MDKTFVWIRNGFAVVGVLALGFWLGSGHPVHASNYGSGEGVQFQLTGIDHSSSLLVYHPETRTVYVYQGAMQGNSALQCTYMFRMDEPGGVIRRDQCAVQKLIP